MSYGIMLGVRINRHTTEEALARCRDFLRSNGQHMVFTPNPEMLVMAHRDDHFQFVLNESSLNLCDGKGIQLLVKGDMPRIPGSDFILDLCKLCESEGKSVYLLGSGDDAVLGKVRALLEKRYPNLQIVGWHPGHEMSMRRESGINKLVFDSDKNDKLVIDIVLKSPDVIFVAFGHGKQELWIQEHLTELPSVKIAMGVGGAFDFLAGKAKRAPKVIRSIGFEWLWRLIHQPKRFKRIVTAVIVFPLLYARTKFQKTY